MIYNSRAIKLFIISPKLAANLLLALWAVSVSMVFFIPDSGLFNDGVAYFKWIANSVPAIEKMSAASAWPKVTFSYMVLQWAIITPFVFIIVFIVKVDDDYIRRSNFSPAILLVSPLVGMGVFLVWWFLPWDSSEYMLLGVCGNNAFDKAVCLMSKSKIWLGVLGTSGSVAATALFCGAFFKIFFIFQASNRGR